MAILALAFHTGRLTAAPLLVPNNSFESPEVPFETPYANPNVGVWQKANQPVLYDPSQNGDWNNLAGQFYNVPFPGQFIDNCDGDQGAFLFAVPEVALFQDYDSVADTNGTPNHAFEAVYNVGKAYELTVGLIGGGFGMKEGVALELSLYYREVSSNKVNVASISVTHSVNLFPTNTHFVDFQVHVPTVKETDPWAGKHIGIQLLSTVQPDLAGGYWDVDNVRLTEKTPPVLRTLGITNGHFNFSVSGEPGVQFEVQATTNVTVSPEGWTSLGVFENPTGVTVVSDAATNISNRYYRARQ